MCFCFALLALYSLLTAQPASTHYVLPWRVIDGGGNEGGSVASANYRLSSAIAQGTPIGTTWTSSSSYLVHPGFRKVDLDWRPPYTQLLGTVVITDTITTDSVLVQWTGQDTTIEEGEGWGMWVYDVQIKSDTSADWFTWLSSTTDTAAWLSELGNGHWYYFRVRGHDLATNVPPWDTSLVLVDVDSVFVVLEMYTLELHTTHELCSLWVDGVANPAPFSQVYSPGTGVHIDVADSAVFGDTIMAIFDHWAVLGVTDTALDLTMDSSIVDTAVYNIYYSLDVTSAHDTPVPSGHTWVQEDSAASGYITDGVVDIGGGNWAVCTGFIGTGSAPSSGSGWNFWFIMEQPSSITWVWDTIPAGSPLCTLIVYSPYGHPMPSDTTVYPIGTLIYATVEESVYADGAWHHCTGWLGGGSVPASGVGNAVSFVITESSWLVWCWDGTCLLPLVVENEGMSYDPTDGYGDPDPDPGTYWIGAGSYTTVSITSVDPGAGMCCVGYWASGSIFPPAGVDTFIAFTLDEPTSIHWRWYPCDTTIVCLTVWSEYDAPNPPVGTSCYPIATVINATVAESAYAAGSWHHATGYWGTGSVPTDTSCPAASPNSVTFTLTENSQLVWVWDCRLRFPFVVYNEGVTPSDPDGYDTPFPTVGVHWYDAGSIINCAVTSPADGMQCIGHIGTGSVPTDTSTSFSFVLDEPSSVSWRWAPEGATIVYLAVYSEYGDPDPPVGVLGYVSGTYIFATVQDSALDTAGVWHHCTGWVGGGSVPASGDSNEVDFNITTDSWIVWRWDGLARWPFVVAGSPGEYDAPVPSYGTHWYNEGDTVSGYVTPIAGAWYCVGYDGWGDLWDGSTPHFEGMVITQPSGVTWLWTTGAHRVIVRKLPEADVYGQIYIDGVWTSSAAETFYVADGATVNIAVSNPDYASAVSRYSFLQWTDGVTDTNRTEGPITSDAEFVAQYDFEYLVVIHKDPEEDTLGTLDLDSDHYTGSASAHQEVWWQDGSNHTITVSERDSSACARYIFSQWEDGSTTLSRSYTVSGHDTLTAFYDAQYYVVIAKDPPEPYGCIYVGSETYCGVSSHAFWADAGSTIQFAVSYRDTHTVSDIDSMYTFQSWSDGETDTLHPSVVVSSCDSFIANYVGDVYVICLQLDQYGSTGGVDSVFWHVNPPGDTLDPGEVKSMDSSDVITVTNCGNVDERMYLWVQAVVDTLGSPLVWSPGYLQGDDQFVLRGRFENVAVPPTSYDPIRDYLKSTPTAATDEIFGPAGGSVSPTQSIYLFFQFLAPTASSVYEPATIIVGLKATLYMP